MNWRNPLHLVLAAVLGLGLLWPTAEITRALWAVRILQVDGFCEAWRPLGGGEDLPEVRAGLPQRCVRFANDLEKAKYRHNVQMAVRSGQVQRILALVALGGAFGLFYLWPVLRRRAAATDLKPIFAAAAVAFVIVIGDTVLTRVGPPVTAWAPAPLRERILERQTDALQAVLEPTET